MKYSTKLSDSIHILVFIYTNPGDDLSSATIARSLQTNPSCVRQFMMKLRKAGILNSVAGHAKPTLAREAKNITMLDIYRAVEGEKPLLHLDTHTNPECGVGVNIQYAIQEYYDEIQKIVEEKMSYITLEDIVESYYQKKENFDLTTLSF